MAQFEQTALALAIWRAVVNPSLPEHETVEFANSNTLMFLLDEYDVEQADKRGIHPFADQRPMHNMPSCQDFD